MAMRPLNGKERRRQFLFFMLLFALAIAPFVVLVHLYGRVDHAENRFLREQYAAKRDADRNKINDRNEIDKYRQQVAELRKFIADNSSDLKDLVKDQTAKIENDVDAIDITSLPRNTHGDSTIYDLIKDLKSTLKIMNEVYREGIVLKKEYTKLDKEHEKCPENPGTFGP